MPGPKSAKKTAKKRVTKFTIDCACAVHDQVLMLDDFEKFLHERIKINGKAGNLGDKVRITKERNSRLVVIAEQPFSKRYLKYLTKKYLKKQALRDFLRIIATPNSKNSYVLKYFEVTNEEA